MIGLGSCRSQNNPNDVTNRHAQGFAAARFREIFLAPIESFHPEMTVLV